MLIYAIRPSVFALIVFVTLWIVSGLFYRLGWKVRSRVEEGSSFYLPGYVTTTIQATLSLILGFTFSLAIARFETRRQLVVDESNQVTSTYSQAMALRQGRDEISSLLRRYVDARIEYYDHELKKEEAKQIDERTNGIEKNIWETAYRVTKSDRGAIENGFLLQLNQLSDLRNARNIALTYTLPREIYWVLYLLSIAAIATASYSRGSKAERGRWQPLVLVAAITMVLFMILDIDQPMLGGIQISQDAMLAVRDQLASSSVPRAPRGQAAGKAGKSR